MAHDNSPAKEEAERLEALYALNLLDTDLEPQFDRLTRLAADSFGVPISLLSLVDANRQWFKSRFGLDVKETARDISFCTHAIQSDETFVVDDATANPRFRDNPLVTNSPSIRFYAGAPLISRSGHRVGTLCVIDRRSRRFSPHDERVLRDLADIAMDEFELRLSAQRDAKARQLADEANRAKSIFLSRMSHEIRTPLTGMLGSADMLLAGSSTDTKQLAANIREAGHDLLQILNDILDLAKIEQGRLDLHLRHVDVRRKIQKVEMVYAPIAREKGLSFRTKMVCANDAASTLLGDPTRIRQVLFNLVANAIKFTDMGFVEVTAELRPAGPGRTACSFRVADSGIGIPPECLERIFGQFEQVDTSATRRAKGTGLGLAIVKQLTAMMKGKIAVESQLGKGTIFTLHFEFDAVADSDVTERGGHHSSEEALATTSSIKGLRVLLAEDHPNNRRMFEAVLRDWGCHVTSVADGALALETYAPGAFDCILLDINMPRLSGIDVCRTIRGSGPDGRAAYIAALTADATIQNDAEAAAAGFDEFVIKPVDWRLLFAALLSVRQRKAAVAA